VFVASYALKPHALRPLFWYADAKSAVGTGRTVFFTNIVNWVLNNLDRVLIGRLLNAQSLGLYNVAYNLATMPNTLLLGALQPAFLAAGARLQNDLPRLGRAYLQMLATMMVLGLPAFATLAVLSPDIVRVLYGPAWSGAAWVLGILFLCMPAYVIWGLSTPVLWNTGRKHYEFALQLPLIVLGVLGFYVFARQGIHMAAVVAGLLLVLRAGVTAAAAFRALELRWTALLPDALRGLLLCAASVSGVMAGRAAVAGFSIPLLSLAASGLLAAALPAALLAFRPQILGQETSAMVIRFVPGLAKFLRRGVPAPCPELSSSLEQPL
jgi:O-antigen/teichoic acid export membrane protein